MVRVEEVREWAAAFPEVEEGTHFRLPSLKVSGKVFVLVEKGEQSVLLSVDEESARAAADSSSAYEEVWRNDRTIFVGVRATLATAEPDQVEALVEAAWRNKAPKRLAAEFDRNLT